ncbi:MAG: DUF3391 domain-containing protein, partial [Deltaproteobacteria bacterium]|nr:DUF3391 domain-containing protein [Deltaproteobacteria bacterium]
MGKLNIPEYSVPVDQLRVGVFVRIDGFSWFNHPFLFKSFKIKNNDQIQTLKELGVTQVICIPEKSDVLPTKAETTAEKQAQPALPKKDPADMNSASNRLWQIKREKFERLKKKRQSIARCEKAYTKSLNQTSRLMKSIAGGNINDLPQIVSFISEMSDLFLEDKESTLHLMTLSATEERVYYHSLNVAVLSMMLGKETGLDREQMEALGIGALFHDIGKSRIEKKILLKKTPLTKPEMTLFRMHPKLGVEILAKAKESLPRAVFEVIYQHHEFCDGKGYPAGLGASQINHLAKAITIIDTYDNYCNRSDPKDSLTPYQALSVMFSKQKHMFDAALLATFVRCLGVFPPGSIVALNNGAIGMVVSVNPQDALHPSVLVYDPEIPKDEAVIIDL